MSVVRIPGAEEDLFPWSRVAGAVVLGGALGLGIAYWGMEGDRTADAGDVTLTPAASAAAEHEVVGSPEATRAELTQEVPTQEERTQEQPTQEQPTQPTQEEPTREEATQEEPEVEQAVLAAPDLEQAEVSAVAGGSRVSLRRGRVAYLRCDGVPQRAGPFPCPRDEPLERGVWEALAAVQGCVRAPRSGQADVVLDFEGDSTPTIRTRDTFPADTPRTDDTALLACTSELLGNVRSSLSPRRLVVSFRLTLEPGVD